MLPTVETSNLQSGSWYFVLDGMESVVYKLNNFVIPSVSIQIDDIGNQSEYILKMVNGRLEYDNLPLEFIVDADLFNYRKCLEWLKSSVHIPQYKTISVFFVDGSKELQAITLEFLDCFPYRLTPLLFDSANTTKTMRCTMDLAYTSFDFV